MPTIYGIGRIAMTTILKCKLQKTAKLEWSAVAQVDRKRSKIQRGSIGLKNTDFIFSARVGGFNLPSSIIVIEKIFTDLVLLLCILT
jgi:hypothetical protein